MEEKEINNLLKSELVKLIENREASEEVEVPKEETTLSDEETESTDTEADTTGVESDNVETSEEESVSENPVEELETIATDGDMPEAEEVEPKGVEVSKIEDVVEEEVPAASEAKKEPEGEVEEVQEEREKKGDDKPRLLNKPEKIDNSSAIVAEDKDGNQLIVKAISSYSKNQRYYLIYEKDADGKELGALNYGAKIEAAKFEKKSNAITDYIKNMDGNYNGQLGNIQLNLQKIEKYRMLKHSPILDVDSSTSFEEFYEKLKLFILHNVFDSRISVFTVKNATHVAIIRTTDKTIMQVFKDVCREIDESVNPNVIKAELYNRGLLYHDNNQRCRDCQLTISTAVREMIGSRGDKVISIKFDDDFVEKIKLAYSVGSIEYEEDDGEEVI